MDALDAGLRHGGKNASPAVATTDEEASDRET
jgi:hypothetical protein